MSKLKETQMFERNTNRNRIRKKKETELDKENEETVKKTKCLNEAEHETRIDHIDNIMIYSFYDIDSLKAYVTLNNLLKYNNNHTNSANNNLINSSRSKSKRKELHKSPSNNPTNNKKNDLEAYEMNYLKKLDDNLLDNDELSSLSNEENDSEIDSYNNNDSKAIIWQTTATEIEKQKQIKKNLLNKKERNISITSSTVSNRSAFSTYSIRSDSSRCSLSPDHSLPECGKAHCKLGCICDEKSSSNLSVSPTPLKNNNNNNNRNQNYINNTKNDDLDNLSNNYPQRDHCGRFECMFECNCSRRLRSSTRSKSQNKQEDEEQKQQQQNEEDDIEEEENQQQETEEKSFKRQNSKKTFPNTRQQETKNIFSNSTKNRLKLDSKAKSISKNEAAASAPSTQLRQSKRVKLLKKKSNLKTSQTNKDQCHPSSKPSFKDFYFYYDQDNKLSSLKSRNKNKKLKQETNSDNNSDELEENNKNNNNNNEIEESKINTNNKNDSDFTLESKVKPKKKSILNDNNNNNNNKSKQFEPYTQNITLKVQPKTTFLNQNNGSLVSIQLRIEVFTSKWNKMPQLNKKILRILAKLLQKLNVLNETANTTFNFKEIEFECDNEINVIVFASSHLKDCSNTTKDDLTNKPICIKVTNYNTLNKALLTKQQIKTLVSDENSDQSNQIFNLVLKKNEETYTDLYNSKHDSTKNIENIIQKDVLITKSLPRLLCRGRNNINDNNQLIKRKPNQTSLIFKSVDNLFEKIKNSPNKYDKLSSKLFEYRPSYISDVQKQHQPNDIGYIFADEIDYFKKNSLLNNNNQYPFYDPFTDKSLILPMYKTHESVEFVDSICNTINDMIKVVSLYNNNNNSEKMTTLQKEEPLVVSTDQKKQEIIKIQNTGINESKYVIKIQQPVISKNTDINNNNIQKKIIIPSTSMNFKTLVRLVSNKDNETKTKTNTNSLDNLNCKIFTSSNTTTTNNNSSKIKISSSLVSTSSNLSNVASYSRSIFKTTTSPTQPPPPQQITKIFAPITSSSSSVPPKIITMPFKSTSNSTSTMSKIVSIPNSSSSSSSSLAKTFVPIRPKQEISIKQSTLTSLIMNDNHQDDLTSIQDNTNNSNNYMESRKRKRKQDLSSFNSPPPPIKSVFTFSKIDEISPSTNNNNNDNIHLNILNKQINCIKNETSNNLEDTIMSSSKLSIISNSNKFNKSNSNSLNTAFKISPSIFKQVVKKDHHELSTNGTIKRANSIDSLNEKDLLDVSSTSSSSNLLFSSISSHKHSSSSNESSKSSKILVSKENDSEDEILESDNSDFSDMDCCASTSNNKRKRKKSKNSMDDDDASSDESSSNEYEDEFEKKIAKKLLGSINNSNKPIVNNIHSIRERQRRFRLKKLLIKLKIVLYECESNCKYDLENSESKLKLEEYFNQKNFKMKSKQNILQEAVLLIRGLQKQENQLQTLLSLEMKKNADLKFHLKELI